MNKLVIDCTAKTQRMEPMTEAEVAQRQDEQQMARERRAVEAAGVRARVKAIGILKKFSGQKYNSLTAAETRELLGAVLYKIGVLDEQGKIK